MPAVQKITCFTPGVVAACGDPDKPPRHPEADMQQQISVITLGVAELARSRRFYAEGFGWKPVFEVPEIIFYQMNGLMLGTWLASALAEDSRRPPVSGPGAFSLAHN